MEKINIAELLKDCPKGMELDCPLFENLEFDRIDKDNGAYSIICRVKTEWECYNTHTFTEYGCYSTEKYSKCVIFPKGKTTWEGFHRPFKDGDIAISERGDIHLLKTSSSSYCAYRESWKRLHKFDRTLTTNVTIVRLATEEEKAKLFQAIKDNGYKWNSETKTLERLVEPRFKVGDEIKKKGNNDYRLTTIESINNNYYVVKTPDLFNNNCYITYKLYFSNQDNYELVLNKFDINTLKVFDKVLVRDSNESMWSASIFSHTWENKYICIGIWYNQCIPYEGNEHLLGTTKDCDEYYKTWE